MLLQPASGEWTISIGLGFHSPWFVTRWIAAMLDLRQLKMRPNSYIAVEALLTRPCMQFSSASHSQYFTAPDPKGP